MKMAGINAAIITLLLFFVFRTLKLEVTVVISAAVFVVALITGIVTYKVTTKHKRDEQI